MTEEVKLSELRAQLTKVMEKVKNGQSVLIRVRGVAIAAIIPYREADNQSKRPDAHLLDRRVQNEKSLERTQSAQRARDDILRGVNKKK